MQGHPSGREERPGGVSPGCSPALTGTKHPARTIHCNCAAFVWYKGTPINITHCTTNAPDSYLHLVVPRAVCAGLRSRVRAARGAGCVRGRWIRAHGCPRASFSAWRDRGVAIRDISTAPGVRADAAGGRGVSAVSAGLGKAGERQLLVVRVCHVDRRARARRRTAAQPVRTVLQRTDGVVRGGERKSDRPCAGESYADIPSAL